MLNHIKEKTAELSKDLTNMWDKALNNVPDKIKNPIVKNLEKGTLQTMKVFEKTQNFILNKAQNIKNSIDDFSVPQSSNYTMSNTGVIWLIYGFFVWLFLYSLCSYTEYLKSLSFFNLFGWLFALVSLILIGFMIFFLLNDFIGITTVSRHIRNKEYIRELIQNNQFTELKNFLLSGQIIENNNRDILENAFLSVGNVNELMVIYEEIELKKTDKTINDIINKYSLLASTAAIKDGYFNFLIMFVIFSKMVIDISKEYKIKLGFCSFFNVMFLGLMGSSLSALTTKVIGTALHQIPGISVFMEVGTPIVIMKVLGCKAKYALRPLDPYSKNLLKNTFKEIDNNQNKEFNLANLLNE